MCPRTYGVRLASYDMCLKKLQLLSPKSFLQSNQLQSFKVFIIIAFLLGGGGGVSYCQKKEGTPYHRFTSVWKWRSIKRLNNTIYEKNRKSLQQSITLFYIFLGSEPCPASHGYAIDHGQHCCASRYKLDDVNIHEDCDGSFMSVDTNLLCCPDNDYVSCRGVFCSDKSIGKDTAT